MEASPKETTPISPTPDQVKKKKIVKISLIIVGVLILVSLIGVGAYFLLLKKEVKNDTQGQQDNTISFERGSFASVTVEPTTFDANVPSYTLGDGNANIVNLKRFGFNDETKNKLLTDKFVVVDEKSDSTFPNLNREFFGIYEDSRYSEVPNFITSDAVLHNYHLVFDDILKTLETTTFSTNISTVIKTMFDKSVEDCTAFGQLNEIGLQQAAARNVGFFAVASKLLGTEVALPTCLNTEDQAKLNAAVTEEIALIAGQSQSTNSPVLNLFSDQTEENKLMEDYSQYIPRGHYTGTEELKKYFQTMIWFGRITFRQRSDSENLSALLMARDIGVEDESVQYKNWSNVYDAIGFIVGNADDLGIYEYNAIAVKSFNGFKNADIANKDSQAKFLTEIKKLSPPKINSIPIFDPSINPDREAATKGFRFMGQRYTLDANVFQDLIYRSVGENSTGDKRYLPNSLDLMAAMGSTKADTLLNAMGVNDFKDYTKNMTILKDKINSYQESYWTSNSYNGWLYMIKPLLNPVTGNYPEFMKNDNWVKKDMNTFQGSWTELKHDTLLYSKQSYAEAGAGGGAIPIELDYKGYVEPRFETYARLEALSKALLEGLTNRGLLSGNVVTYSSLDTSCNGGTTESCTVKYTYDPATLKTNIESLTTMSTTLKTITQKELTNTALTDDENKFIKEYGAALEHNWEQTLHKGELRKADIGTNLEQNPAWIVADVATDPAHGEALEEATGNMMTIYVVIPTPGKDGNYLKVAKGVVYTQYEFTVPTSGRLTDQQWQAKVKSLDVPPLASWKDYSVKSSMIEIKPRPGSYQESISKGYMTIDDAKAECENPGSYFQGKFEASGNVCPEDNMSCGKMEPVCRYY